MREPVTPFLLYSASVLVVVSSEELDPSAASAASDPSDPLVALESLETADEVLVGQCK